MEHEPDEFAPSQQAVYVPDDRRIRHDGWTIARQEKFLRRLAGCGCVAHACAAVGMSRQSFYDLHERPGADGFRRAVEAALDAATSRLDESAFSRSIHGVPRPIFYKGEQVGEYRHYDERLTMFLLRYRRPHRYGAHLDKLPPPLIQMPSDDPFDQQLDPDEGLNSLEFHFEDLVAEAELPGGVSESSRAWDSDNFVNFVGFEPPSTGEELQSDPEPV